VKVGVFFACVALAVAFVGIATTWQSKPTDTSPAKTRGIDVISPVTDNETNHTDIAEVESHLWREIEKPSKVEFEETPLSEVIEAFNQSGRIRIEIADRQLEGLEVTGQLDSDNPETLLKLLELVFEIKVERLGENRVTLRASAEAL